MDAAAISDFDRSSLDAVEPVEPADVIWEREGRLKGFAPITLGYLLDGEEEFSVLFPYALTCSGMLLSSSTSVPYPSPYFLSLSFRLGVPLPPSPLEDEPEADDDPFLSPHVPRLIDCGRKEREKV